MKPRKLRFESLDGRLMLAGDGFDIGLIAEVSIASDNHHDLHGVPDFAAGGQSTLAGAGADTVVHLTGSATISQPLTVKAIGVHGTLIVESELRVKDLLVYPDGQLILKPGATIIFRDMPLDLRTDPDQWGTGLIVLGSFQSLGTPKTEAVRLAAEPIEGSNRLLLAERPENWKPGDKLILPDTRGGAKELDEGGTEYLTIKRIDGNIVEFNEKIRWEHRGARDADGNIVLLPHLVNTTRDIMIRSENPNGVRGHTAYLHRASVDIRYTSFELLGRTTVEPISEDNVSSRYPVHFHHLLGPEVVTNDPQFSVVGNVVRDDFRAKWGIVIHGSHYGEISRNVVIDTDGSCIVTENGSESYNWITDNISIQTQGSSGDTGDMKSGIRRDGLWLRGPQNYVQRNVYYGAGAGVVYFSQQSRSLGGVNFLIPQSKGAEPSIEVDIRTLPLLVCEDTETWGARHPIEIWDVQRKASEMDDTVINGIIAANGANEHGGINVYSAKYLHLDDIQLLGERKYEEENPELKKKQVLCRGPALRIQQDFVPYVKVTDFFSIGYPE